MKVKNITQKQAKLIRKAISNHVGSRTAVFPRRGHYYIMNPLSDNPTCVYIKPENTVVLISPENLVFQSGFHRHDRVIPTYQELEKIEYGTDLDGNIRFLRQWER